MFKSNSILTGCSAALLAAGCSLTMGDMTLTPQKASGGEAGNIGGKSNQGGGTGTATTSAGGSGQPGASGNSAGGRASGGAANGAVANGAAANGGASNNAGTGNSTTSVGGQTGFGGTPLGGATANGGLTTLGGNVAAGFGATGVGGIAVAGGVSTGGVSAGGASAGGVTATGGVSAAGSASTGGSGCTGSYETIQSTTGLCVARMTSITPPTGSAAYSINSTEVTRGQYEAWLAMNPDLLPIENTMCGWNRSYQPSATCMNTACKSRCDHHPQVCVDWCDADAYCRDIGKRLCGKIGGGARPWSDQANAETDQWYRACSSGGVNAYVYGPTSVPKTCNDYEYWAPDYNTTTTEVGALIGCQSKASGYAGVFDLGGNAAEWEDSCESPAEAARCYTRGEQFFFSSASLTCNNEGAYYSRKTAQDYIGFRCCSF